MSEKSEQISPVVRDRLFVELGRLGIDSLHIGNTAAEPELPLKAVARETGSRPLLKFGFGIKGFPFAFYQPQGTDELMVCTSEWNPSLVATRRVWHILGLLRSLDPGKYGLPASVNSHRDFSSFDRVFRPAAGDSQEARQLREAVQAIGSSVRHLTVTHPTGLARDHVAVVEGSFEGLSAGSVGMALNQADEVWEVGRSEEGFTFEALPEEAINAWPWKNWHHLDTILHTTFNRMPVASTVSVSLS